MDENRLNDAWDNLASCCGTCHANKTMHRRKKRHTELHTMLQAAKEHMQRCQETWAEPDDFWAQLPQWLQARLDKHQVRMYSVSCRQLPHETVAAFDWEQYKYTSIHM